MKSQVWISTIYMCPQVLFRSVFWGHEKVIYFKKLSVQLRTQESLLKFENGVLHDSKQCFINGNDIPTLS